MATIHIGRWRLRVPHWLARALSAGGARPAADDLVLAKLSDGAHWHDPRADIVNDPPCTDPACPLRYPWRVIGCADPDEIRRLGGYGDG